jgi:laminin gamma 1
MIVVSYFIKRLKSSSPSLMNIVTFYLILLIFINALLFNHIVNTQQIENDDDDDLSNELNDPNSINSANYDHEDHFDQHDQQNNNNNNQQQQIQSSLPTESDLFDYRHESDCYDSKTGAAKKCMPEFINVAYGSKIYASNTCGLSGPTEYCVQTNSHNLYFSRNGNGLYANGDEDLAYINQQSPVSQSSSSFDASLSVDQSGRVNSRCQKCDANDRRYSHSAEHLNDYHIQGNVTWWQSDTMLEGIQYPNSVNLTLHFGKSFDINYVQIKFHSPRPESFAIYKRTYENGNWIPYQYYSASCKETYNVPTLQIIRHGNEAIALCTDEFSDIAPLTGASVVFGTLEDRPSAYNFENSEELKEWVTATDIRITLDRLNTFGDEVFNDPQVLKSYYYAISDIAVGGR